MSKIMTASKITVNMRLDDHEHFAYSNRYGADIMITQVGARFSPDGDAYFGGSGFMIKKDGTVGTKTLNAYTMETEAVPIKIRAKMINAAILELQKWSIDKPKAKPVGQSLYGKIK